jgi:hypothetical protein
VEERNEKWDYKETKGQKMQRMEAIDNRNATFIFIFCVFQRRKKREKCQHGWKK